MTHSKRWRGKISKHAAAKAPAWLRDIAASKALPKQKRKKPLDQQLAIPKPRALAREAQKLQAEKLERDALVAADAERQQRLRQRGRLSKAPLAPSATERRNKSDQEGL